jgi:glycosyltransferase involved in cell wall biosynthesis
VTLEHQPLRSVDVSVVIPAYQAGDTIGRALDSVLNQAAKPGEIIVVDDGSSDRTVGIVEEYISASLTIVVRMIRQENLGAGAARNRGLAAAIHPLVAFLDADDEWLPDKLARSIDVLAGENADFVAHDFLRLEGDAQAYVSCARHFSRRPDPFVDYFLRGYIGTSTVVARRQTLLDSGGFDPTLRSGQDYELWLSVIGAPDTRHHVFAEALTKYHVTSNSITSQVGLRHEAAVRILYRHLPALKGNTRWPRGIGMLRAVIVCVQAAQAHRGVGNYAAAIAAILRIPIHVISIIRYRMDRPFRRPDFISRDEAEE